MDMVELAIEDHPYFKASDIEFRMAKPSYTIDTLTYLQERYPSHSFVLIVGEDNLTSFVRWKNYKLILENFGIIVFPRPDSKDSSIKNHPHVKLVDAPRMDISASFIRKCIKENKSIKYLVPDKVYQFITDRKLYR
jgi:nicotinate-nucleotide adenylyltransferase